MEALGLEHAAAATRRWKHRDRQMPHQQREGTVKRKYVRIRESHIIHPVVSAPPGRRRSLQPCS